MFTPMLLVTCSSIAGSPHNVLHSPSLGSSNFEGFVEIKDGL